MALVSLKAYIAEARKADGKYTEEKIKGVITKVIHDLEGSEAGQATKLARRYHRLQVSLDRMEKAKNELNEKLRGMVEGAFDVPEDILRTRILATAHFTITLNKQSTEGKPRAEVDYDKIFAGIKALIDEDLQKKVDELIEANTRRWTQDPPKPGLSVKPIEEGVVDAAAGALGKMLTKLQDMAANLKKRFTTWGKAFDGKLKQLEEEAKGKPLTESKDELWVVIGNPGRSQPSALWPKTDEPEAMTRVEAEEQAQKINDGQSKITYGALPSGVHWHAKPLSKALDYVIGPKAIKGLKDLKKKAD